MAPDGRLTAFGRNGNATLRTGFSQHLGRYHPLMPPYKEQGIVLRSIKLGEADKIVSILTQGSGKVRGVAKGIRKTTSRFGGRLEPFTHVNLMLYRGRGALDTITQAEIIAPHRNIRDDLSLFAAGETMLEASRPSTRSRRNTNGTSSSRSCCCQGSGPSMRSRPSRRPSPSRSC